MPRMIRFHRFGQPQVLQSDEVARSAPGPAEVLVRVQAVGLGWKDALWRQNLAAEVAHLPVGVGFELAGVVSALGEGVRGFRVGDAVAAFPAFTPNQYPAWGDEVLMPCSALTLYPSVLSPVQASVHYMGYLYSYLALVELAGLKHGQSVLITEASRYLAPQAVILAKALGAIVLATTSRAQNRDFIKALGADHVVVTEEQDLVLEAERVTLGRGVDVIYDQCAGPQMKLLGEAAAYRGKLVLYSSNGANDTAFPARAAFRKHLQIFRHCILDFTGCAELGIEANVPVVERALAKINQLTEQGLLPAVIDKVFAFDDFIAAHQYLESCPDRGRIALQLGAD